MDALILAGGLGTRLRAVVSDRAKPVASVGEQPFVLWMMRHLAHSGQIDRFIVCTGHMAQTVQANLGLEVAGVPVCYSEEDRPLGTGGALRLALSRFRGRGNVVALNGDSHVGLDLGRFAGFFAGKHAEFCLTLSRVASTERYGRVEMCGDRVSDFREKGIPGPGWINAGVYLISPAGQKRLLAAPEVCSFEREVLPAAMQAQRVFGYRSRAAFIDIGVPEDYRLAQRIFARRP